MVVIIKQMMEIKVNDEHRSVYVFVWLTRKKKIQSYVKIIKCNRYCIIQDIK